MKTNQEHVVKVELRYLRTDYILYVKYDENDLLKEDSDLYRNGLGTVVYNKTDNKVERLASKGLQLKDREYYLISESSIPLGSHLDYMVIDSFENSPYKKLEINKRLLYQNEVEKLQKIIKEREKEIKRLEARNKADLAELDQPYFECNHKDFDGSSAIDPETHTCAICFNMSYY